jgi:hypothetical protein
VARDWEQTIRKWSKPSSDTECDKQSNAERMISEAIREYEPLKSRNIKIIPQGSYRNNTNVKTESDVDICVCCMEPFFDDYSVADYSRSETGIVSVTYTYAELKNDVHKALVKKFGATGVNRGDKAFDVHPTSYRVDADVVAAFAYRLYLKTTYDSFNNIPFPVRQYIEPEGIKFFSDSGKEIINWREQHARFGIEKNSATGSRFKFIVRALKNLKNEMENIGIEAAKGIPSYLIECLVYNVPNSYFTGDSYADIMRVCVAHIIVETETDEKCKDWEEVNKYKYLFRWSQPWTREQVRNFALAAWVHAEF